jgi:pyruvate dehydrogenase E1 component alpha subunit
LNTPADGTGQMAAPAPTIVPSDALPSAMGLKRGSAPSLTPDQERHAHRQILLIRRFEQKAGQIYGMGLIGGISARKPSSVACG